MKADTLEAIRSNIAATLARSDDHDDTTMALAKACARLEDLVVEWQSSACALADTANQEEAAKEYNASLVVEWRERALRAEAQGARIEAWTHEYGAALVPHGPDTYGEGMRDAKQQVAKMMER